MQSLRVFVAFSSRDWPESRTLAHWLASELRSNGADVLLDSDEWQSHDLPLSTLEEVYRRPVSIIFISHLDPMSRLTPKLLRKLTAARIFDPLRLFIVVERDVTGVVAQTARSHSLSSAEAHRIPLGGALQNTIIDTIRSIFMSHSADSQAQNKGEWDEPIDQTMMRARALYFRGRSKETIQLVQSALGSDPYSFGAWTLLCNSYREGRNWQQCTDASKQAIENVGERVAGFYCLGTALLALQQPAESEHAFKRALSMNRQHGAAWFGLGQALVRQDRLVDARRAFQSALAVEPFNPWAYEDNAVNLAVQHELLTLNRMS